MKYSNPTKNRVIENWPSGSNQRVTATFSVESNKRGDRAVRQTTGKPKALTYHKSVCFADGDDGKTYVLQLTEYGHISIMRGTFDYQHETIFPNNERYEEVFNLIKSLDKTTA